MSEREKFCEKCKFQIDDGYDGCHCGYEEKMNETTCKEEYGFQGYIIKCEFIKYTNFNHIQHEGTMHVNYHAWAEIIITVKWRVEN